MIYTTHSAANHLCPFSQLAEQYGNDVASEVLARSRSNLQLDAMPTMPYSPSQQSSYAGKYDSVPLKAPGGY